MTYKPTATTRIGFEYQDLVGIEILIEHYRDPNLYEWVLLEADDSEFRALDDIVALRKDSSFEFYQVKFTVDSAIYEVDWEWLLAKRPNGTTMITKWSDTLLDISERGSVHTAALKTNRVPSAEFAKCLQGSRVKLELVPDDLRKKLDIACGGSDRTELFFREFQFVTGLPDLRRLELSLRDQIVPRDTDMLGWLSLRDSVRTWATNKGQPSPQGRIQRRHISEILSQRRPKSIRQDFAIPANYSPPSSAFDSEVRERLLTSRRAITVLWGTPGKGKSTYLSHLTKTLEQRKAIVIRHHYFISEDEASTNRTSFAEIATSLLEQLRVRCPTLLRDVPNDLTEFRVTLHPNCRQSR